jgi:anti-anti-sigma factor
MRLTDLHALALDSTMHMVHTDLGDAQLLSLTGRLDAQAAPELEQRCRQLIGDQGRTLIINVGALDHLSSAGLRTLLSTGKSLQSKNGKMVLVAAAGPVRKVIEHAGFDKIFPLCATVEEVTKQTIRKFQILHTNNSGAEILAVSGRVDAERAPELEEAGRRILAEDCSKLVIDLSAVEYLSSAGLCSLLNLVKLAKTRHCSLVLCGPNPTVRQVLKLSGFDKLFPIREELSGALFA